MGKLLFMGTWWVMCLQKAPVIWKGGFALFLVVWYKNFESFRCVDDINRALLLTVYSYCILLIVGKKSCDLIKP